MKYKHIVFDIDGTLIDTEYALLHSLQETILDLCGRHIPLKELTFALGITGADALKRLGMKDIAPTIDLWNEKMQKYTDTIKVFDGIKDLLEHLSKSACETGIVTSKTREEFDLDFRPFGISHYFKTIICADDTTQHKPSPAPLLQYMKSSGAAHSQLLYIGDSSYDSLCASNAQAAFALAKWGSHDETIKADYYLTTPASLLHLNLLSY